MAIKNDHRNLRSGPEPTTTRPAYMGVTVANALIAHEALAGPLPMATAHARVRHSWAGSCAKQIGYKIAGVPETEPVGQNPSPLWSFRLGRFTHEVVQEAITEQWSAHGTVEHEVALDCGVRAGTADTIVTLNQSVPFPISGKVHHAKKILLEYKSMGGFKFKQQVKEEGPAKSAYLQAAMNAIACDADVMVLCSMALDQMSPNVARQVYGAEWEPFERFWAEWWFPREVFEQDGLAEGLRLAQIVKLVDTDKPVPRHVPGAMPDGARITDPASGKWVEEAPGPGPTRDGASIVNAGSFWGCSYCPFQSHCVAEKQAGR